MLRAFLGITIAFFLIACDQIKAPSKVSIALNPWPGNVLLYLADKKQFFSQVGINVELVRVSTLADVQRAYLAGEVDGFASTLVEVVQVGVVGGTPSKVVLIADYSHGSDVIISASQINSVKELKGKTVGCEVSSLGTYILGKALAEHQMTLADINIVNIEQESAGEALALRKVVAVVTYPPYSIALQSTGDYRQIFTTKEIPEDILDVLSISEKVLQQQPLFVDKLRQAWKLAFDYLQQHPQEAIAMMAAQEGLTVAEYTKALDGLNLLSIEQQRQLFQQPKKLQQMGAEVCETLVKMGAIESNCLHASSLFYLDP
ncbi:ABC transporter substrate-binding protein [Shewanella psychrotolerans]|uniref:ABC transporter substrate-binding protein n=1 Tax=Shewanella psychrotolerans TaxID=2864206 RepID=UPI001C660662|nr:ABC transporter substrate-binding protein [Shewanella psychrotolerans]QYK01369.1 ABC transporter substrate-binding protein [Shewanella psychrotolerans]